MKDTTTLKEQVRDALKSVEESPDKLVCLYRPKVGARYTDEEDGPVIRCTFDELPERPFDDGFGGREGEKFIGFTDDWIFVCGVYDGSEWIQAVPRTPEVALNMGSIPVIGGE